MKPVKDDEVSTTPPPPGCRIASTLFFPGSNPATACAFTWSP